jgi:hypothetical protein
MAIIQMGALLAEFLEHLIPIILWVRDKDPVTNFKVLGQGHSQHWYRNADFLLSLHCKCHGVLCGNIRRQIHCAAIGRDQTDAKYL